VLEDGLVHVGAKELGVGEAELELLGREEGHSDGLVLCVVPVLLPVGELRQVPQRIPLDLPQPDPQVVNQDVLDAVYLALVHG